MSIYLELTRQFNSGRLRAIISSGQAVVLLRLTVASKDGDWILREDQEGIDHVLAVLEARAARYRFGAPLDLRWLQHGWSSHLEFQHAGMRVRTDLVTRPPRVNTQDLAALWREQEGKDPPFTGPRLLLEIKKTAREKDWPLVGELARLLPEPREQALCSRSAHDLIELSRTRPNLVQELAPVRPALAFIPQGRDALRIALERERFAAMDADDRRIRAFLAATAELERAWPDVQSKVDHLPLRRAHAVLVDYAQRCLPVSPSAPGESSPATSS